MIRHIIFAIVLFEFGGVYPSLIKKELIQISVITRHGQRTPEAPFPKDPWTNLDIWPEGWMQLTAEGKKQMKILGKLLRDRYTLILPVEYRSEDVMIRSSDTARTLDSASALLSGLYPSQSVPIQVSPKNCDPIFYSNMGCPAFDQEMEIRLNSPEVLTEEMNYGPLYKWLTLKLGKQIKSLKEIETLYTNFVIEEQRGLELPEWAGSVYPEPARTLAGVQVSNDAISNFTTRIRFGPILNNILKHAFEAEVTNYQRLFVYSAHDSTIAGILKTLDCYDGVPPGFAAVLIFEVHQDITTREKEFRIFYREDFRSDLQKLHLPGCGYACSLSQMEKKLKPFLVKDLKSECKVGPDDYDTDGNRIHKFDDTVIDTSEYDKAVTNYKIGLYILAATIVVFVIGYIFTLLSQCESNKKKSKYALLKGDNFRLSEKTARIF
ncbi:lysosomal acid phosphatase-like [Arctopsyche grandis]|uniref:lysosomal acid phosphatase-like n=1 Tax=Arctopsyche grandis TaxID=121162 RepID=UPI00406D6B9D